VDLHDIEKETFDEQQLKNNTEFEGLLLNSELAPEAATLILPGLRHVSGVKEWGCLPEGESCPCPTQKRHVSTGGAQSLGLSTRAANAAYRCYLALEQMKSDEEFGERAEPRMYSFSRKF
jgi:hypothetical protein